MASKSDEVNSKSIGRKKKKKKRTKRTEKLEENQLSGKSSASTVFDVNELSRMNKSNLMSTNKFLTSSKSSNIETLSTEKGLKSKPKLKNQKKRLFPSIFTGLASSISAVDLRSRSFNNDSASATTNNFEGYILHFVDVDNMNAVYVGYINILSPWTLGCFRKTLFQENQKYNPQSISLGVSLKRSTGIFDFDKV